GGFGYFCQDKSDPRVSAEAVDLDLDLELDLAFQLLLPLTAGDVPKAQSERPDQERFARWAREPPFFAFAKKPAAKKHPPPPRPGLSTGSAAPRRRGPGSQKPGAKSTATATATATATTTARVASSQGRCRTDSPRFTPEFIFIN